MILLKNQTSVPVPQVFNAYMIEDIGFILMEKIHGIQLSQSWSKLPPALKESLVQVLRGYIQQWRQIEGSFFGTVNSGPCQEIVFQQNSVYKYGPFASRKDFNKGMVEAMEKYRPNLKLETETDILFAEELLISGTDQEETKILTHGDLDHSNIMIQDGKITGIIDWGAAGYSVPEREYFALRWPALDREWARTLYLHPTARWI